MAANITLEWGGAPKGLPELDAPLGVQLKFDNSDGWSSVSAVYWKLYVGSDLSLATIQDSTGTPITGAITSAPFWAQVYIDQPGGYLVHLRIEHTDGSVSVQRAYVAVKHPGLLLPMSAPYELGADPDAESPTPTRNDTFGWAASDMSFNRIVGEALFDARMVMVGYNDTGVTIPANRVVMTSAVRVYKGVVGGGGADPGIGKRLVVRDVVLADGTDLDAAGNPIRPLYLTMEEIRADEYGRCAMTAMLWDQDLSGIGVGTRLTCGAGGVMYAMTSKARMIRPLFLVISPAAPGDDPPGALWFDGRPSWFSTVGAVETGRVEKAQTAGSPVWDTLGAEGDVFNRLTAAAASDVGTHLETYRVARPMSQWRNRDFSIDTYVTDITEATITILIKNENGDTLYSGDITPSQNVTFEEHVIGAGVLTLPGSDVEPFWTGEIFTVFVQCAFGSGASPSDEIRFNGLACGKVDSATELE